MQIQGIVTNGVGQGAQFLALDWVRRELREKLNLAPFPGTLNLRVAPEERAALFALREQFIRIADASSPECPGYLVPVTLHANGRTANQCWIILPEKTVHADILEIISAHSLRAALSLEDTATVRLELEFTPG
jgi:riboflavin kinase